VVVLTGLFLSLLTARLASMSNSFPDEFRCKLPIVHAEVRLELEMVHCTGRIEHRQIDELWLYICFFRLGGYRSPRFSVPQCVF